MQMEHYFSSEPTTKKIETEVSFEVDGVRFDMAAASGTFSSTKLDAGTKVLLSHTAMLPKDGNVLDLGCGWGPIGIVIAALHPASKVHAVDINQRSIEQTRANADRIGLPNLSICLAEDLPSDLKFDAIWSNPPIRIGKVALHELLRAYIPRLGDGGRAVFVVQKNLGADSLIRWLAEEYPSHSVSRIGTAKTYRIIEVANPAKSQNK
jgi:16S rRNA (guanine1207-N2)-methyltransferase|tara:strand:- start:862 stop:1485 length:624 start_codon:yes stop_codon:yes gene_type:complete